MLTIQINGETRELQEAVTVQQFIQDIGISSRALAVAVNSEIVPRSEFDRVRLRDRDRIEIIRAVGGG